MSLQLSMMMMMMTMTTMMSVKDMCETWTFGTDFKEMDKIQCGIMQSGCNIADGLLVTGR